MPGRVEGKVALVTGAAAGRGAAHARLLAHAGHLTNVTNDRILKVCNATSCTPVQAVELGTIV